MTQYIPGWIMPSVASSATILSWFTQDMNNQYRYVKGKTSEVTIVSEAA